MTTSYAVGQRVTASLLQDLADNTVNRPLVRLIATSTQSLTDNTGAPIAFGAGSTVIDTHGFHDEVTNNTRVTPTRAGYYRAWGKVCYGARGDYATLQTSIRLNGSDQVGNERLGPNTTNTTRGGNGGPIMVLCNGTTDYIELAAIQDNVANVAVSTNAGGSSASYLEVEFVRPA